MRYDIYAALTAGMKYYSSTSPAGEILRSIVHTDLEYNVKHISRNFVEFSIPGMEDTVEAIASKVEENPDNPPAYRNAISFCTSTAKGKKFSSEEIIGYDKATGDFNYSCIEIIEKDEKTLIVGGCVSYKNGDSEDISIKSAKLGKWVYDNQLIKEYKPLEDICTSRLDTIDVFEKLCSIQRNLVAERYIRPEDYVYAEIGQGSSNSKVTITNDGELEEIYNCDSLTNLFINPDDYQSIIKPKKVLSLLNEMSDCLFIHSFDSNDYGKFDSYRFIKNAPCEEDTKDNQAKTHVKTYKGIMIVDPKK